MKRWTILIYGVICYAAFLASFLYLGAWLGNIAVPSTIDAPRTDSLLTALLIDVLLVGIFATQHSVMARPAFKRRWTRFVPEAAERSTYVLLSSVALLLLFWQWRPLGGEIWRIEHPAGVALMHSLLVCGLLAVVVTTFLINHFDLFGLRQVWLNFRGTPYTPLPFRTPGPYRLVRHPLYIGWLLTFWATPTMTVSHLCFALGMTAYILVAIPFEERDLLAHHGADYEQYRKRVGRLVPHSAGRGGAPRETLGT